MRSLLLLGAVVLLARSGWGEVAVYGRVLDERGAPVADAHLSVVSAPESQILAAATTDSTGSFKLKLDSPGSYLLNARKEGFFEIKQYRFTATEPSVELLLTMNVLREVFQSLDVNGTPSPVDLDQSGTEERLSGTNINAIPFPSTDNLRNALRLMPGTIQDPTGRLHFQGGAEWQTNYLLEGFRVGDPIDGTLTARVAVEGVRSAEFLGGNFSPNMVMAPPECSNCALNRAPTHCVTRLPTLFPEWIRDTSCTLEIGRRARRSPGLSFAIAHGFPTIWMAPLARRMFPGSRPARTSATNGARAIFFIRNGT